MNMIMWGRPAAVPWHRITELAFRLCSNPVSLSFVSTLPGHYACDDHVCCPVLQSCLAKIMSCAMVATGR